jgi:hypothetical protein
MSYDIIEARIEFTRHGLLSRITVLVQMSKGDVRAIFATTKVREGYMFLAQGAVLNDALLQEVAGLGMETVDRDDIFPNWKVKLERRAAL